MKKQFISLLVLAALGGYCEEVPDFSPAFDAMWALGAVEFKEGVLVKAEPEFNRNSIKDNIRVQMMGKVQGDDIWPRLSSGKFQPGATHWLIESNRAGRITLLGGLGQVTQGYDASVVKQVPEGEALLAYKIKPCDLKQDLALVESALDNALKEREEQAGKKRRSYRSGMMSTSQSQLLYALTALHKAGHKEDAGRLVQKLLRISDNPESIIIGVISQMGLQQYQEIMRGLPQGRSTYAATVKEIDALLERFGEEWKGYAAAKSIRDDMAQHDTTKPPAEMPGLSAAEQRLAADLVTGISFTNQFERNIFLLVGNSGYNWLYDGEAAAKASDRSVILRIVAGGIKSIPMLVAICDDKVLTGLMRGAEGYASGSDFMMSSYRTDYGDQEIPRQALPSPITRGEFAIAMLSGIVSVGGDSEDPFVRGGYDPFVRRDEGDVGRAAIKKRALDFYNANKDKSLIDLAFTQLQEGEGLGKAPFLFIARTSLNDEALSTKLETLMLEKLARSDKEDYSMNELFSPMQLYCRLKGERAAGFVQQVGVKLALEEKEVPTVEEKKEPESAADEMYASKNQSRQEYIKKMQEQTYKRLKQMTAKKGEGRSKPSDFKAILDDWGAKKIDEDSYTELASTAQDIALLISGGADVVSMYSDLLDAALLAQDAEKRSKYLILVGFMMLAEQIKDMPEEMFGFNARGNDLSELERMLARSDKEEEEEEEEKPESPESSASAYKASVHAGKWRKLMQDERPFPDMFGLGSEYGMETMGDMTMFLLCQMSFTSGYRSLMELPPTRVAKLLRSASEHVLSGKEASEFTWPTSGGLSDEDLDKLAARVKQLKPDQLKKFLEEDISDTEYFAMILVINRDKDILPLLTPYTDEVHSVHTATNVADSVANIVKGLKGQKMSIALLKQAHTAICRDVDLAKEQNTTIAFTRGGCRLNGWSVKAAAGESESGSSIKDLLGDVIDLDEARKSKTIFLSFESDDEAQMCRLTEGGELSLIGHDDFAGIKGGQKEELWKSLEAVISGQEMLCEAQYFMQVVINVHLP